MLNCTVHGQGAIVEMSLPLKSSESEGIQMDEEHASCDGFKKLATRQHPLCADSPCFKEKMEHFWFGAENEKHQEGDFSWR